MVYAFVYFPFFVDGVLCFFEWQVKDVFFADYSIYHDYFIVLLKG
jgi:hypothetical protein